MNEVAIPEPTPVIGLEDFGAADEQIPRLKIIQSESVFEDNLTKQKFEELEGIALGLVRQRVLFHEDPDEFDGPMCRSNNFLEGHPWRKNFPWEDAGFEESDYEDTPLPCDKCKLKEWGSHPSRDTPYCSEQFTIPFMRFHDDGSQSLVITSFQKSSIKAVKGFLSGFKQKEIPAFTSEVKVTLTPAKRGSVNYSVAKFVTGDATDQADHAALGQTFVDIREFLHATRSTGPAKELDKGSKEDDKALEEDPF